MSSVQQRKDTELQRLVQEYNDKYKTMLAQQLEEKDALEKRLNLEWSKKLESMTTREKDREAEQSKAMADAKGRIAKLEQLLEAANGKCAQLEQTRGQQDVALATANQKLANLNDRVNSLLQELSSSEQPPASGSFSN